MLELGLRKLGEMVPRTHQRLVGENSAETPGEARRLKTCTKMRKLSQRKIVSGLRVLPLMNIKCTSETGFGHRAVSIQGALNAGPPAAIYECKRGPEGEMIVRKAMVKTCKKQRVLQACVYIK